MTTSFFN